MLRGRAEIDFVRSKFFCKLIQTYVSADVKLKLIAEWVGSTRQTPLPQMHNVN